ncbi:hypothetical protein ACMFL9_02865 (plasmid) [Sinorhizobium meliloti]
MSRKRSAAWTVKEALRSIHPRHWPITGHGVKKNTKKEKRA